MSVTPGPWKAVKGDTLNHDRPWGVVRLLTKEECLEIDGDLSGYGTRSEVIAEICQSNDPSVAAADARVMAAAPEMLRILQDANERGVFRRCCDTIRIIEVQRLLDTLTSASEEPEVPPHMSHMNLDQAVAAAREGKLSYDDFVAFFAAWCVGKADHRVHDGEMQHFISRPTHPDGGYWLPFTEVQKP